MIILAVETATEACSAALYRDGVVTERFRVAPREHNRLILPMIEEVLAEYGMGLSRLDALAFGRGPGSFTGVRIATGVVQGIAFAADLPVVPVSTLAALASQAFDEDKQAAWSFCCVDARMGEVYCAAYHRDEAGFPLLEGLERVLPPSEISDSGLPSTRGVGIGSGWGTYHDMLAEQLGMRVRNVLANRFPRAGQIARLGAQGFAQGLAVSAHEALPVYLRNKVANKPNAVVPAERGR